MNILRFFNKSSLNTIQSCIIFTVLTRIVPVSNYSKTEGHDLIRIEVELHAKPLYYFTIKF